MQAINFRTDSISSLENQLDKHTTTNFNPTLAFVFASVSYDIDALSGLFDKHEIQLVGCTTAGEIINDEMSDETIVVLLLDMKKEHFFIHIADEEDTFLAAKNATLKANEKFDNPSLIVFSSGLSINGDDIIRGVNEIGTYPLFGGMAGDDFKMKSSYSFTNNKKMDKALLFLIIDQNNIEINGLATSGWKPVGTKKIATKTKGNILYTIDDKPALDVFLEYFDIPIPNDHRKDIIAEVGAKYPLHLQKDGYTTLRAPLMATDEGALILAGEVIQGTSMFFSMPPDFEIIGQCVKDIGTLKESFPETDAVILVSCGARHLALGPMIEGELEGLRELWNAPLTGFFSYGEIGAAKGTTICDLHNETVSLILLKEK